MEFNFSTSTMFKCDQEGFGIINGNISRNSLGNISIVLDTIGNLSAKVYSLLFYLVFIKK